MGLTRLFFASAVLLFMAFSHQAYAALQFPKPMASDPRFKVFVYNPMDIYVYTGYFKYASSIDFEQNESIDQVVVGDPTGWQIKSAGNRMFLKPVQPDATTNMTVYTDKRIYYFELYAAEAEGLRDEQLTFLTKFAYPDASDPEEGAFRQYASFSDEMDQDDIRIEEEPERYNFNYSLTGSQRIAPLKVFDDGEFTYMEFNKVNADIPAIFMVYPEGDETIINYRMTGDFIVIERVASQFTLRHGKEITCVYNDARPFQVDTAAKKEEKKFLGLF